MIPRFKNLDPRSDRPLHEQLREQLAGAIAQGQYGPGDQLPSEGVLCRRFGVSRITVRQALAHLVHEGRLVKRQGKGTFVAEPASPSGRKVITLLLANMVGSFMSDIVRGVEQAVREQGYDLHLCIADDDVEEERRSLERVIASKVAGLLLFSVNTAGESSPNCLHYLRVVEAGMPLLFVDRYLGQLPIGHVVADDEGGMRDLTQHMIDQGYTRIGYLHVEANATSVTQRLQGFLGAMADARLAPEMMLRLPNEPHLGCSDAELAYREIRRLLAEGRRMPRALVAVNLSYAIGAYRALKEAGIRVPQDVALAGFGDLPEANLLDVPMTSVRVPVEGMGRTAAERLIELIRTGADGAEIAIRMPTELVVRASCGAVTCGPKRRQGRAAVKSST